MPYPQEDLDHIVAHAPRERLQGKRIFLTGATGWFGSWLSEAMTSAGISFAAHKRGAEFPAERFDYLIHCSPADTRLVLDWAVAQGVEKTLYISSGAVYDVEDSYAQMKMEDEAICKAHPSRPIIARCFTFVGPGEKKDSHRAAANFLSDAVAKRDVVVKSDGSAIRSYMYMADLAIWLLTLLVKGIPRRVYDVGSTHPVSIADLAEKIAKLSGSKVAITGKPNGVDYYVPSTHYAEELGLGVWINLDASLAKTYGWLCSQ